MGDDSRKIFIGDIEGMQGRVLERETRPVLLELGMSTLEAISSAAGPLVQLMFYEQTAWHRADQPARSAQFFARAADGREFLIDTEIGRGEPAAPKPEEPASVEHDIVARIERIEKVIFMASEAGELCLPEVQGRAISDHTGWLSRVQSRVEALEAMFGAEGRVSDLTSKIAALSLQVRDSAPGGLNHEERLNRLEAGDKQLRSAGSDFAGQVAARLEALENAASPTEKQPLPKCGKVVNYCWGEDGADGEHWAVPAQVLAVYGSGAVDIELLTPLSGHKTEVPHRDGMMEDHSHWWTAR